MEQCAEEEVARDPLVIFHVERSFAILAILSLLHLCLFSVEERAHLASSLAPSLMAPPSLGAQPAGAQAGGPLQRQCSGEEAATLAGGITWSLEPETSTVFLPPLPPTSPASSSSGTPGGLLERSDIMRSNLSHPPQEFVPHLGVGCSLRAMTPARMRQCLRGRGLLFVGDSVSRYQYLGLAQALETGLHVAWDPPSEHDNYFGTWANFYAATTERLGGHSHCDCWRPPNDWPQSVCRGGVCGWAVSGNRYYRWEEEGLEVNFLETLGGAKDPPLGVFHAPQTYFGFHCNSSSPQDSAACLASGAPPLCSPGWCSSPPEHVEPMWDAIRTMVRLSSPTFMILNSGIWGIQWGQDGRLEALMSALDWAALPQREGGGGVERVVWKTTTQQLTDLQKPPNYQEWWPWENFDAHLLATQREDLVVAEFEKRGWKVVGAAQATLPLKKVAMDATCSPETRSLIFLDGIHYARSIYRGLNEILMTMLCAEGN